MEEKKIPKFCRYCGSPLDPGALFCATCGVPVKRSVQNVESVTNTEISDADQDRMDSDVQDAEQAAAADMPDVGKNSVNSNVQEERRLEAADVSDVGREYTTQNYQSEEEDSYKIFYGTGRDHVNLNNQKEKDAVEYNGDDLNQNMVMSNGRVKCIKCNFEMEQDMRFCPRCGADVTKDSKGNAPKKICRVCGKELRGTEEFCPYCGKRCDLDVPEQKRNTENHIPPVVNQVPEKGGPTGTASLVLGIISIVIAVFSAAILGWAGAIVGIIGIILGANDRKNSLGGESGTAKAGWICSIIGTSLNLLFYVACIACAGAVASQV